MNSGIFTYLILAGVFFFGFYVLYFFVPFGIWIKTMIAGVSISLLDLIDMKIRRVEPSPIVKSMIMAAKAEIHIQKDELEAHSMAGGNVEKVVTSMINAKNKNLKLTFKDSCKMDLLSIPRFPPNL